MAKILSDSAEVGNLLTAARGYSVPPYQRDYSWESEQIEALWDDIISIIDDRRSQYFIGSIVLNVEDPKDYRIIDGQQRLATISILICVLRDFAKKLGDVELASHLAQYLGTFDFVNRETRPRLSLNLNNRDFFNENIINGGSIEKLRKFKSQRNLLATNRKIAACYVQLFDSVSEVADKRNFSTLAAQIIEALNLKIQVILINVVSDYDAYILFETLNDRGLALSVSDLLKNYIFSKAGDRLPQIQENWRIMALRLDRIEVKRFLRHFWLSNFQVVRDKALYREMIDKFRTPSQVYDLSKSLYQASDFYAALYDSGHELWNTFNEPERSKAIKLIGDLNLLGVNQYHPLLLAVLETNADKFVTVLRAVVAFAYRYSIIMQSGTGNIERTFTEAARYVRNNPDFRLPDLVAVFSALYPKDESFIDVFRSKQLTDSHIARYTLIEINNYLEKTGGGELLTNTSGGELNLEHVLPQRPTQDSWGNQFAGQDLSEWVHRIGNLTLLPSFVNKKLGNSPYSEKRTKLDESKLRINEFFLSCDDWTPEAIESRQAQLARFACQVWRIDS